MNLSNNLRHWLDCGHRAHPGAHIGRAGGGMPHPSPLHPPFRPYGFMAAGVCRMLFDRQAGGCHTHPLAPPCPTVWVPGPSASAVCCCPTSGRGDATPIPPAPPFRTVWVHGPRAFAACCCPTSGRGDATPIPPCTFLSDRIGSRSTFETNARPPRSARRPTDKHKTLSGQQRLRSGSKTNAQRAQANRQT